MKAFFISGTILFAVLILILAFENMTVSTNGFLFILIPMESTFLAVLSIAGVGSLFGVFITGLIVNILKGGEEEETGSEWQAP